MPDGVGGRGWKFLPRSFGKSSVLLPLMNYAEKAGKVWVLGERGAGRGCFPPATVGPVSVITGKFMFLFDAFSGLFGIIPSKPALLCNPLSFEIMSSVWVLPSHKALLWVSNVTVNDLIYPFPSNATNWLTFLVHQWWLASLKKEKDSQTSTNVAEILSTMEDSKHCSQLMSNGVSGEY